MKQLIKYFKAMRYFFNLVFVALFGVSFYPSCSGQIVTGNYNSFVTCCSGFPLEFPHIDSIDTNNDSSCELWIQGLYGVDDYGFNAIACSGVHLNEATAFGDAFPKNSWDWYGSGLPYTVLLEWGDWWLPNSGSKYLGFRRVNSIADTTYGWIELDFKQDPSGSFDTLFIRDFAYSLTPNTQLDAGQTELTSYSKIEKTSSFNFYPNPFDEILTFNNYSVGNCEIILLDVSGRVVAELNLNGQESDYFMTRDLQSTIYFLFIRNEYGMQSHKIIKR